MAQDKTNIAARELLKRGHATVKELLTISFGEWPPKGLDINPAVTHSQETVFLPFMKDFKPKHGVFSIINEKMTTQGRASLRGPRFIRINKLMARGSLSEVFGHEVVHNLQGDNYYRAGEIYGVEEGNKIKRAQNAPTSTLIMLALVNHDKTFQKNILTRSFRAVSRAVRPGIEYLQRGTEAQAFLHDAMAEGYRRWGRLPGNRTELWSAMISLGLTPPKEIRTYLDAQPKDAPFRDFILPVRCGGGRNLDTIDKSLTKEAHKFYWRQTLPALYADLIEMYGDRQGGARFGWGPSSKAALQARVFGPGAPSPQ